MATVTAASAAMIFFCVLSLVVVDIVQNSGLSDDGSSQGRVNLLGAHPSSDGQQ